LTRDAEQYLARHYQGQASAQRFAEERKALREMESDEGE
jgi:demethoxyubiquinone hydroxylase (CLK1/Coq7/Cat5 family)